MDRLSRRTYVALERGARHGQRSECRASSKDVFYLCNPGRGLGVIAEHDVDAAQLEPHLRREPRESRQPVQVRAHPLPFPVGSQNVPRAGGDTRLRDIGEHARHAVGEAGTADDVESVRTDELCH